MHAVIHVMAKQFNTVTLIYYYSISNDLRHIPKLLSFIGADRYVACIISTASNENLEVKQAVLPKFIKCTAIEDVAIAMTLLRQM